MRFRRRSRYHEPGTQSFKQMATELGYPVTDPVAIEERFKTIVQSISEGRHQ
jgi:hypothetical protein